MTRENSRPHAPLRIYSFVDGGPAERLCAALRAQGVDCVLVSLIAASRWRAWGAKGQSARLGLKLAMHGLFPLLAAADAMGHPAARLLATTNPFLLPAALTLPRALHRQSLALWVYDWMPDVLDATQTVGPLGRVERLLNHGLRRISHAMLSQLDAVIFLGDNMARHLTADARRLAPSALLRVIPTGAARADFVRPAASRRLGSVLRVSYVGNLGRQHDWQTLAAGISALPPGLPISFILALTGSHRGALRTALSGRDDLRFAPPLASPQWAKVLSESDVALVSLNAASWQAPVPSKTFSAMAAGCAILAVAPARSDLAKLIRGDGCGLVVEPGDGAGLARALQRLATEPELLARCQNKSQRAIDERFEVGMIAARWREIFARLGGELATSEKKEASR